MRMKGCPEILYPTSASGLPFSQQPPGGTFIAQQYRAMSGEPQPLTRHTKPQKSWFHPILVILSGAPKGRSRRACPDPERSRRAKEPRRHPPHPHSLNLSPNKPIGWPIHRTALPCDEWGTSAAHPPSEAQASTPRSSQKNAMNGPPAAHPPREASATCTPLIAKNA